jgi:long-chain acyl-CoA synthetase
MSTRLTILAFLRASVERRGDEPALGTIRGGELNWRTWREVWNDVQTLAATLRVAGVSHGDRIAQISENYYEWILVDLALHLTGAVHVPIHPTLSGEQIAQQIATCEPRVLFVSRNELLARFSECLAHGETIFVHEEQDYTASKPPLGSDAGPHSPFPSPEPEDLATILFTSGTTGQPRGVMLSQRNLASNAAALAEAHGSGHEQTRLNILPFNHIYARTCDLYTWLYRGSRLVLAESRDTLLRDLLVVRPTALSAVPYVYQRIADGLRKRGAADKAAALAATFGGRMERLMCGGAALAPGDEAWYAEHELPVLCGYGLTEASPVVTSSTRAAHRAGCVGRAIPGVEVRIGNGGEVLVRGPNVMLGYWQDEVATAEAIRDGWLHTGDLGTLDADGYLTLHGRKKELIALSTGKKVWPTRIESLLTASPLIEQAAVFGEGRPALVALIFPATCGLAPNSPELRENLAAEISRRLAPAAAEEQVRHFVVLDRPFSIERGELTPKLSLSREIIACNFSAEIASCAR